MVYYNDIICIILGMIIGIFIMLCLIYIYNFEYEKNKYLETLNDKEYRKYMEFRRKL